jgi:hypothetical protein
MKKTLSEIFKMPKAFLAFLAALLFLSHAPIFCAQYVRIAKIIDSNLFQTTDSILISLANVNTISITDPDSLKREFAKKTIKYGKDHLLGRSFIAERAGMADSVIFVHLFEELLFARLSINKAYLRKGFGYFLPEPGSRYFKEYQRAVEEAERKGLGVYDQNNFIAHGPFIANAFWLSAGLGAALDEKGLFIGDLSAHSRKKNLLLNGGFQVLDSFYEGELMKSFYLLAGFSRYSQLLDFIISAGPNLGYSGPTFYPGVRAEVETHMHLPMILGLGIKMSMTITNKFHYIAITLNPSLGAWNIKRKKS